MESSASKILERAIDEFALLPGVGRRTALKYALSIIKRGDSDVTRFINAVSALKSDLHSCRVCHNICDGDICEICSNNRRDKSTICVVENIKDILAIERTGQYRGVYHVLGGLLSPIDAIGPNDLNIVTLLARVHNEDIKEIIFALSATVEGDSTAFYISKKIGTNQNIKLSVIAKGIAVGNDLDYTDELTLGKSILNRTQFR
ncbi:MAG: recombination protein RecR [Marinifilaceae bacterium]|nr:recombination protein RecR [Marinifilaceae bacterium]